MVLKVLSIGETLHLFAAQRHTLTRSHWSELWRATTSAALLACPQHSTLPQALTSARDAGLARQRDSSRPPRILGPSVVSHRAMVRRRDTPGELCAHAPGTRDTASVASLQASGHAGRSRFPGQRGSAALGESSLPSLRGVGLFLCERVADPQL